MPKLCYIRVVKTIDCKEKSYLGKIETLCYSTNFAISDFVVTRFYFKSKFEHNEELLSWGR